MREIKFKAWDKQLKQWSKVATTHSIEDINLLTDYEWYQYTGLNDKNGEEIYEGDIISLNVETHISEVKWSEKYGCFVIKVAWTEGTFVDLLGNHNENCLNCGDIYECAEWEDWEVVEDES